MKNLSDKAVLVTLHASAWTGRKDDKKIASEIERQHQAKNAGRYKKNLIDATELRTVQNEASNARLFVKASTLPWGQGGARILPNRQLLSFLEKFRGYKEKHDEAVQLFLEKYEERVAEAKSLLGGMYSQEDYPSIERMRRKFTMDLDWEAIAELNDFRLNIDPEAEAEFRQLVEEQYSNKIVEATKDIWVRMQEVVNNVFTKLSNPDARIYDSLVNDVKELTVLLPPLNITADPEIDAAIASLQTLVVEPDKLRKSETLRSEKAKEAQGMLKRFSDCLSFAA